MSGVELERFVPKAVGSYGALVPLAATTYVPVGDLFGSLETHVAALLETCGLDQSAADVSPIAAFVLGNGLAITVAWEAVRASHLQCLIAAVAELADHHAEGPLQPYSVDAACGLTLWSRGDLEEAPKIASIWRDITSMGEIDPFTVQTTPRLYGNKQRLTRFVAPVIATHLPEHAPVLDLMSGTGVMSRVLAHRHPVTSNDANAYAALLTRTQAIHRSTVEIKDVSVRLEEEYRKNYTELSRLIRSELEQEAAFLHGEVTEFTIRAYADFARGGPLVPSVGVPAGPARLVTERYANVYFGLNQSVEIDSLRAAIEASYPEPGIVRDLCLSALLIACSTCSSGPHFAQPPQLKPSLEKAPKSMRTMVERRARSVAWEFDLALARLAGRKPLNFAFEQTLQLDWPEAIDCFVASLGGRTAGVYVDPPYSKLQYSRYYHVLNVILAYDYPPVSGVGRYPPISSRFSSKFEYQPSAARRELGSLLQKCSEARLTVFLSYSDGGFIPVESLAAEMNARFSHVEIFTEVVRHHSQGRPLKASRATVMEHVLVGSHGP
ncbi:MAG: DNA adenine methylase [Phenylobacterium sp.]|nr:DNA adenine methylase [Phenylobacterium sp.]